MKITLYLFYLILLISIIWASLAQQNIVNTLPGYPGDLPFTLETGYVGVGEEEEVQLFYYFIESERDVERDPLILWLTGGPGCSALSGLVLEIGPFMFNVTASNSESDTPILERNPYSWTKIASIIFLDSPVGTGFSYATTSDGYYTSDTLQSTHIYDFLRKWLIKHPKFSRSSLYISGDSYSGRIVPIVVQNILQGNKIGVMPKLNLQGYVLGNPTTAHADGNANFKYAHRVSLLSDDLFKSAMKSCNGDFVNGNAKNTECKKTIQVMNQVTSSIDQAQVLEHSCFLISPKPRKKLSPQYYQNLHIDQESCRTHHYRLAYLWADDEQVREALHIREGSIGRWTRCNYSLAYKADAQSAFDYHMNFSRIESLQALIYSGDQDMLVPYLGTLEWINELKIRTSSEWRPWFVDGQVAGYVTEFSHSSYHLVHTTIKGGGHTAPEYKPRECLAMMDRWLSMIHL
ncbi:serine carboxypeptidase-like 18 [Silene latifolia]|uniref:serine carboxypeptidase-like 18 n=1 Tax=Silene latifolia TaxID=37657 RepID=UPI003D78A851